MTTYRKITLVLTLACWLSWLAPAQAQTLADTGAGRKRAAVCAACHGIDGESRNPTIPRLRGQHREYLEKQLRDFRDGRRLDPTMSAMAKPLSDDDIRNLAAYYFGVSAGMR